MTIEEKKQELQNRIASISIEKWEANSDYFYSVFNDVRVKLYKGENGGLSFFEIEGILLYCKEASELFGKIIEAERMEEISKQSELIDKLLGINKPMKITLLIVCTGKYTQFLPQLLESADKYFLKGHDVKSCVFTDAVQ